VRGAVGGVGAACGAPRGATEGVGAAGGVARGVGAARGARVAQPKGPEPVVYQKDLLEKEKQKQMAEPPGQKT
jgi:hypothetical protein